MRHTRKITIRVILLFLLAFLVACTTIGAELDAIEAVAVESAAEVEESNNDVDMAEDGEAESEDSDMDNESDAEDASERVMEEDSAETPDEDDEITEEEMEDTAIASDDPLVVGDDRSPRLQQLTASWNTDWTRRTIATDDILSGGPPRDGIPSIDNPTFISFDEANGWLADNEPVVAVEINGDARAYPIQILTWHEIANDTVGGVPVIVTFCPLCNSALTFERTLDGEAVEFGVSGLLRNSDLIMYDRKTETLWQQFTGEGLIGEKAGEQLTFVATLLISYRNFKDAYPDGTVLSRETGISRNYGQNPYVGYDTIGSNPFLFSGELDGRLEAVERVVTVNLAETNTDLAYPLPILAEAGVINDEQAGRSLAVFHLPGTSSALGAAKIAEADDVGATAVFDRNFNGELFTFTREGDFFVDDVTGTKWNIVGQGVEGELAGEQLEKIVSADHFWFSWVAFRPDTIIYQP